MLPTGSLEAEFLRFRLPAGIIPVHYTTSCNTQYSAPEDGRNYSPKHVELIGVINKPLLLHLVGYVIVSVMYGHTNIRFVSDKVYDPANLLQGNFPWYL